MSETQSSTDATAKSATESSSELERKRSRDRQRRLARWLRRGTLAIFLLGAVAAIVVAMLPKPVIVSVYHAARSAMVVTVDEDGKTRVKDRFVVSAPLTGHLGRVTWHAGDAIDENSVLARIVPVKSQLLDERSRLETEARLAAAQASYQQSETTVGRSEAAFDLAKKQADRQRALYETDVSTRSTLEEAQFNERARKEDLASARFAKKVAAQQVRMAKAALGRLGSRQESKEEFVITSPVAGTVLRVLHESEGVIQAGTPIMELGDPSALEIVADVLTRDAVDVKRGDAVVIDRWGGDTALRAHVRRVEPSAFTRMSALGVEEQRVNVIIDLDEPHEKWSMLGDGYRVEVAIEIWRGDDVLQVPASAVFRHEDGWAVFVVVDEQAELAVVKTGHRNNSSVEILEGLEPGAAVITHPNDQIRGGVAVVAR